MPCYRPIVVGVRRLAKYGDQKYEPSYGQEVPCGNCVGCKAESGRQWAVRMMHEARMHKDNVFITLTLEDECLNENRELCPKDFSGFIKRLRKKQEREISFFGCGEYGGKTTRPHYHALLFGVKFLDTTQYTDGSGRDFWKSETLDGIWGRGRCEVGTVTMASASYVAGYIRKKVKAKEAVRANPVTGVLLQPEFARMSLRPPIGQRWIKKWWRDVYPRNFVVIDGHEAKPPRYYDKWMDFPDEKGGTQERRDIMEECRQMRWDEAKVLTPYQLKAAEAIATSRANLYGGRGL